MCLQSCSPQNWNNSSSTSTKLELANAVVSILARITRLIGDLSFPGGCRMIESAHMPKAPDAIVEMSPVMTLWHYNLTNSTYVFLAASRHHRQRKGFRRAQGIELFLIRAPA
jgi:hypothetical protein